MNKLSSKEAIATITNLLCAKTFLMVPIYFKRLAESGSLFAVLYVFALAFFFLAFYFLTNKLKFKSKFLYPIIAIVMLIICSINLFEYSMTVSSLFFKNAPLFLIFILFFVGMIFGAYSNTGKLNLFFAPIIYTIAFIMLIFTFSKGNYYYLFPLFGKGFDAVFKDCFFMLSSFFELVVLFFIPDLLEDKKDFKKVSVFSLIYSLIIFLVITSACLVTVHTDLPENCFSPLFLILRQIKIGSYLQHPDIAFLIVYFISAFLYLSTMLYFASHIFSLSSRKLSKKMFLIPFGIVILLLAFKGDILIEFSDILNKLLWVFPFVVTFFIRRT